MPAKYTYPAAGTLLPPQPNELYPNPPVGASPAQIGQFKQAEAQDKAFSSNASRLVDWETYTLGNWWVEYDAGRSYGSEPPKPPGQLWVGVQWDGNMFVDWTEVERLDKPLCDWTEASDGWTINGTHYKRATPPQSAK